MTKNYEKSPAGKGGDSQFRVVASLQPPFRRKAECEEAESVDTRMHVWANSIYDL